jgi:hypothetical protein
MSYRNPDAYSLMHAVRCLDDRAAGRAINPTDLMIAVDALTALTGPYNRHSDTRPEIIDAREGLKQIASGDEIDDSPRVRQRTRQLAVILLAVALDRWSLDREPVTWTASKHDGLGASHRGWDFVMHLVPRPPEVSWRWIARRIEGSGAETRFVRVDDGEAHSALAAELYMVMRADLWAERKQSD